MPRDPRYGTEGLIDNESANGTVAASSSYGVNDSAVPVPSESVASDGAAKISERKTEKNVRQTIAQ